MKIFILFLYYDSPMAQNRNFPYFFLLCKYCIYWSFSFSLFMDLFLQIRYRFGLYDEISISNGFRVRHCNWIRFLRVSETYGPQVRATEIIFLIFYFLFFSFLISILDIIFLVAVPTFHFLFFFCFVIFFLDN